MSGRPVTRESSIEGWEFHAGECVLTIGPRGGKTLRQEAWRRNGQTQLWLSDANHNRFRIPIKRGLYEYGQIDDGNSRLFHHGEGCRPTVRRAK